MRTFFPLHVVTVAGSPQNLVASTPDVTNGNAVVGARPYYTFIGFKNAEGADRTITVQAQRSEVNGVSFKTLVVTVEDGQNVLFGPLSPAYFTELTQRVHINVSAASPSSPVRVYSVGEFGNA